MVMPIWAPSPNNLGPSIGDSGKPVVAALSVASPTLTLPIPAGGNIATVVFQARSDQGAAVNLLLRANGDASSVYAREYMYGNATTPTVNGGAGNSSMFVCQAIPGSVSPAGLFATGAIWLPWYNDAAAGKFIQALTSGLFGAFGTGLYIGIYEALYNAVTPITSIQLLVSAGNLDVG